MTQIVSSFLKQIYAELRYPKEIMIQEEIEDREVISQMAGKEEGKKSTHTDSKERYKGKLVELARGMQSLCLTR